MGLDTKNSVQQALSFESDSEEANALKALTALFENPLISERSWELIRALEARVVLPFLLRHLGLEALRRNTETFSTEDLSTYPLWNVASFLPRCAGYEALLQFKIEGKPSRQPHIRTNVLLTGCNNYCGLNTLLDLWVLLSQPERDLRSRGEINLLAGQNLVAVTLDTSRRNIVTIHNPQTLQVYEQTLQRIHAKLNQKERETLSLRQNYLSSTYKDQLQGILSRTGLTVGSIGTTPQTPQVTS